MVAVYRDEESGGVCVVADRRLIAFNIGSSFTAPPFPSVVTVHTSKLVGPGEHEAPANNRGFYQARPVRSAIGREARLARLHHRMRAADCLHTGRSEAPTFQRIRLRYAVPATAPRYAASTYSAPDAVGTPPDQIMRMHTHRSHHNDHSQPRACSWR